MEKKEQEDAASQCRPQNREEYLDEIEALVKYIGRHGDVLGGSADKDSKLGDLACKAAKCRCEKATAKDWKELVDAYSAVTKATMTARGINGRSVLDTLAAADAPLGIRDFLFGSVPKHRRPLRIAMWLSISALALQYVEGVASQESDPKALGEWMRPLYYLVQYLAPTLVPAVWGGLGACVFLMKQVSDRLAAFTYEAARMKGFGTRVLLGAIFGVVVVQWLFDPDAGDKEMADTLGVAVAAFAAGLGTKAVYAAFEALVEEVASRIKGAGGKRGGTG